MIWLVVPFIFLYIYLLSPWPIQKLLKIRRSKLSLVIMKETHKDPAPPYTVNSYQTAAAAVIEPSRTFMWDLFEGTCYASLCWDCISLLIRNIALPQSGPILAFDLGTWCIGGQIPHSRVSWHKIAPHTRSHRTTQTTFNIVMNFHPQCVWAPIHYFDLMIKIQYYMSLIFGTILSLHHIY